MSGTERLAEAIEGGDRGALARGITLVESRARADKERARALLEALSHHEGKGWRIGITGATGAGKSSLIEALGVGVLGEKRLAVLAVDPTSPRSGGSVMGDKTRMDKLSRRGDVFIRPSPSGGAWGGVGRGTRGAMALCEAAGFEIILTESVGVGQSEMALVDMTDFLLVCLLPGGGDSLQGIKRGLIEEADSIAIMQADGEKEKEAKRTAGFYEDALRILGGEGVWQPRVSAVSAHEGKGLAEIWKAMRDHRKALEGSGDWEKKRDRGRVACFRSLIRDEIWESFAGGSGRFKEQEEAVWKGRRTPEEAAFQLLGEARLPRDRTSPS